MITQGKLGGYFGGGKPGWAQPSAGVTAAVSAAANPAAAAPGPFADYGKRDPSKAPGSAPIPGAGQAHYGEPQPTATPATPQYGYASGPGVLENWFNQRANGTDPGYEYATKRGLSDLATGSAARGSFNSGAAAQDASDFETKMAAAREGQLDNLATGASAERQGRLNSMFTQGLGLAGGQAGTAAPYDMGTAASMTHAGDQQTGLAIGEAGVDPKAINSVWNRGMSLGSLFYGGGGGGK